MWISFTSSLSYKKANCGRTEDVQVRLSLKDKYTLVE